MVSTRALVVSSVIVLALAARPASAQSTAKVQQTEGGPVSVSFIGGLSAGSSDAGAALGGTVAFDLADRVAVEMFGAYLDRGAGASAVAANLSLLVGLLPADRSAVPYVAVGGGVYRASFDLNSRHFFGGMGSQFAPGTMMVPLGGMQGYGMSQGPYSGPPTWQGPWSGSTYAGSHMPDFYAQRMGVLTVPADSRWGERHFTDPVLSFGGGVRLDLTPHLSVRPDARVLVVVGDGDAYTIGTFGFNLGYRF